MKKSTIVLMVFLAILSVVGIWHEISNLIEKDDKIETLQKALDNERTQKANCSYALDSANYQIGQLSKYKTLTDAMSVRDDATKYTLHIVGDIVYMKNDSSRVVISDIIIGGSRFSYYVKFKVTNKNNETQEVIPELVYSK